jgi:hypothetical protein
MSAGVAAAVRDYSRAAYEDLSRIGITVRESPAITASDQRFLMIEGKRST